MQRGQHATTQQLGGPLLGFLLQPFALAKQPSGSGSRGSRRPVGREPPGWGQRMRTGLFSGNTNKIKGHYHTTPKINNLLLLHGLQPSPPPNKNKPCECDKIKTYVLFWFPLKPLYFDSLNSKFNQFIPGTRKKSCFVPNLAQIKRKRSAGKSH